ncbi:MAG: ROK family protein [Deltaproteobacteria bacterium]|nr:ROK family protein [Deltaproteobacteria bacterium]
MGSARLAGIDIGGTKLYALVTDAEGKILGRAKKKTRPKKGYAAVLERVEACFAEALEAAGVAREAITAVGVGAPSAITPAGVAVDAPNLGWKDAPLARDLEALLGRPVRLDNDCNCGALGELSFGAGRGHASLVGLFVGTGLGGGIVHEGKVLRGHTGLAAELGHLVIRHGGRTCGCGREGCLEAYASKTAMGRRLRRAVEKEGRPTLLTELGVEDLGSLRSGLLARAYREGDALTREVVDEAADYLGAGVASVITALGPEIVVLGGGVMEALGEELLPLVRASARRSTFPDAAFAATPIELGTLGDDAVALGAVALART